MADDKVRRWCVDALEKLEERFIRIATHGSDDSDVHPATVRGGEILVEAGRAEILPIDVSELAIDGPGDHAGILCAVWCGVVQKYARTNPMQLQLTTVPATGCESLTYGRSLKADWRKRAESFAEVCHDLARELAESMRADTAPAAEPDEPLWTIEAGGFKFNRPGSREFYRLTPLPLKCLSVMIKSRRKQSFGYDDFRDELWPNNSEDRFDPEGAIRANLGQVRKSLKQVVYDCNLEIDGDPLPNSGGGWQFLMPR